MSNRVSPKPSKIASTIILTVFIAILTLPLWRGNQKADHTLEPRNPKEVTSVVTDSLLVPSSTRSSKRAQDLPDWIHKYRYTSPQPSLDLGIKLAQKRRAEMSKLIISNPEAAIGKMLKYKEYLDLPPQIADLIEKPFACTSSIDAITTCTTASTQQNDMHYFASINSESIELHIPSNRKGLTSKKQFPLVGIALNGHGALHPSPAPAISNGEARAVQKLLGVTPLKSDTLYTAAYRLVGESLHPIESSASQSIAKRLAFAEKRLSPFAVSATLSSEADSVEALSLELDTLDSSWTQTPKRVLFLILNFSDTENPITFEEAKQFLEDTSSYISEYSYSKTRLGDSDVSSKKLTLKDTREYYRSSIKGHLMASEAKKLAAAEGYSVSDYDIIIYHFPDTNYGFAGQASVGGTNMWISGQQFLKTYVHEIGHNFGLWHASYWASENGSPLPPSGSESSSRIGRHEEYGDSFDPMGTADESHHYNAFEKARLGWITTEQTVNLNEATEQVVRLYRFDHPDTDPSKKKLLNLQFGKSETLNIAYRFDTTSDSNFENGAYVTWPYEPDKARLLNMGATVRYPNEKYLCALEVGKTFSDPSYSIHFTTTGRGGEGADAWIDVEAKLFTQANIPPSLDLSDISDYRFARVFFSPRIYTSDPEDDPITTYWDFGDGSKTLMTTEKEVMYAYPVGGTYKLTIHAHDKNGNITTKSKIITVEDLLAPLEETLPWADSFECDEISYQDGRFFAYSSNQLYSSLDGLEWQLSLPPLAIDCLLATTGRILAAGHATDDPTSAKLVSSPNGKNWTDIPLPDDVGRIKAISYGQNTYIALTDSHILSSKDSTHWETIAAPWSKCQNNLVYASGIFLAIDEAWRLYASYDSGKSWKDITDSLEIDSVSRATQSEGKFYCVSGNWLLSSKDTIIWERQQIYSSEYELISSEIVEISPKLGYIRGLIRDRKTSEIATGEFYTTDFGEWYSESNEWYFKPRDSIVTSRAAAIGCGRLINQFDRPELILTQIYPPNQAPNPPTVTTIPNPIVTGERGIYEVNATDPNQDDLKYFWSNGDNYYQSTQKTYYTLGDDIDTQVKILKVSDSRGGITEIQITPQILPGSPENTPYSLWAKKYDLSTTPAIEQDSDSDGIPDIGEYAFNANPQLSSPSVFAIRPDQVANVNLQTLDKRISYICRLSSDLKSWIQTPLTFDPQTLQWTIDSLDVEIDHALYQGQGIWTVGLKLTPTATSLFLDIKANYQP